MKKKRYPTGFTLLEVLIVLIIISIITAVAVLAFGDFGRRRHEKMIVELLQRTIFLAQQQAILQSAILELTFTTQGYQFYQYHRDIKTHNNGWQKLTADVLSRPAAFRHLNMRVTKSKILFSPNGNVTPFRFVLCGEGYICYQLAVAANGNVKLAQNQSK